MAAQRDNLSRILAFVSVGLGALALLLACIGIGTPNWQTTYTYPTSGGAQISTTNNFFYTCVFSTSGNVTCYNRNTSLVGYVNSPLAGVYTSTNDTNARLQNAAGLSVVGILFIALGTVATLIMVILPLYVWFNLIPPLLLFLACLFTMAGLAEGARVLLYNDYASALYETAHLFTILSFGLSSLAAGRIHFEKMYGEKTNG